MNLVATTAAEQLIVFLCRRVARAKNRPEQEYLFATLNDALTRYFNQPPSDTGLQPSSEENGTG